MSEERGARSFFRESGEMSGTKTRRGTTVLIIDDDPLNTKLLGAILRTDGYMTLSANHGGIGREIARKEQPDLILLDIMMPDESGFDTCAKLKQDSLTADIPIIFISALGDVTNKVQGLGIGAVDYITKPFEQAEVLARTRLHLKLKFVYKAIIDEQAARLRQIRDAQQAILIRPEDFPEAKFGVSYIPHLEAGGDFYDVFPINDVVCGYFVADISGHDLGASYTTSALKALIVQNAKPMYTPIETMKIINDVLAAILTGEKHLTACYAHLSRLQARLTIICAGHPPVIYLRNDGDVELLSGTGDVLGAFENVFFEPVYKAVSKRDRFFLYTDGIIEKPGDKKGGRTQGIRDLAEACKSTKSLPIDQAVTEIISRLFPKNVAPRDDLVLLGVEV